MQVQKLSFYDRGFSLAESDQEVFFPYTAVVSIATHEQKKVLQVGVKNFGLCDIPYPNTEDMTKDAGLLLNHGKA